MHPTTHQRATDIGNKAAAGVSIGFAITGVLLLALLASATGSAPLVAGNAKLALLWAAALAFVGCASATLYWALRRHGARLAGRAGDAARMPDLLQRANAMFELANMGISEVALDGRFLRVNHALCAITGYSQEELLAMHGQDLTPAEDRHLSLDLMRNAIEGKGDRFTVEKRYVRKDGSLVWIELYSALARDAAGNAAYFISQTHDISQRRAAEGALRESEARYRSVIDHMSAGLIQHDADGAIVACNARALALLGLTREQMFARRPMDPAWRTVHEDGSPMEAAARPLWRVLDSGTAVEGEVVGIRRPDGTLVWLQVSAAPLPGQTGARHGALVTFADVTHERETLQALRMGELRYRTVVDALGEAVMLIGADNELLTVNPAAKAIYGADFARLMSDGSAAGVLSLFDEHGAPIAPQDRPISRARRTGEGVRDLIARAERSDGSSAWLRITALPVTLAGGSGVLLVIADVSAARATESALKALTDTLERRVAERTAELSQLNRELESFAYSVSHDLRAPLRAITGFSSLLRRDETPNMSPEGATLLERIGANAARMGTLIDDVLTYSRVIRIDHKREDVDVGALVQEVLAPLQQSHPETTCRILPLGHANADIVMLRQILQNLLGNAFKYSSRTPDATVTMDVVEENGVRWFRVSDNGAGFDMRYADRLFGMFQRMHPAAEFSGTGVGLAIVKRLVERHGGQVQAHAERGKGATFRFHLGAQAAELPA
jgi:PAS domain S-box-containing protein